MGNYFEVTGSGGSEGLVNFKQKGTSNLVLENGTSFPGSPVDAQIFWRSDTNGLYIWNGVSWQLVSTAGGTSFPLLAPDGSSAAPSYSFSSSTNSGLFYNSAGSTMQLVQNGGIILTTGTSGHRIELVPPSDPTASILIAADLGAFIVSSPLNLWVSSSTIKWGTANQLSLTAANPSATGRSINLPDPGTTTADVVLTASSQTIGGAKTFSSDLTINTTSNQLVFGVTNTTTISATAPAASSIYTIPDVGTSASFVMTAGAQTISGSKYFSTQQTFINGNSSTPSIAWNSETNSGFYQVTGGVWGATTQGTLSTYFTVNGLQANTGSVSAPGYAFAADTSTGMYRGATSTLNFATAGTARMSIDTSNVAVALNLIPSADITRDLGSSSARWTNIWGQTIHSGDVCLENDWRITEGDKVGHPEEGVVLMSPDGKAYKIMMSPL